ncbi:MAG TPA: hypothetical protein VFQ84_12575 [Arenimonas sp.]|uniref:hypothetical protein n=1 Tax=Arenimonas sp. TaxID=1872635 RepID=UPI002D7F40E5|nr:hypothetical protein [Arenimonas sp.]HEU0154168.1 hypothetical protein [Arenimonas sp.]
MSDSSPLDRSLLPAWRQEADAFAERLGAEFCAVDMPEEVWHFLHDADIRAKDPRFREIQIQMIHELIQELENGIVPEPRGATLTVRPRSLLVVAALLVGSVAIWLGL